MTRTISLALHRQDLRVHDQPLLHAIHNDKEVTHLLPLYVFDERYVELSGLPDYQREGPEARTRLFKFWRTGVFRARFLAEAVYDLRKSLKSKDSDLLVRFGKMEKIVDQVVESLERNGDKVKSVYLQKDWCSEELAIEARLRSVLSARNVKLVTIDFAPLIDVRDLPFTVSQTPDVFTPFRKRVEGLGQLGRPPLEMPSKFKPFPKLNDGKAYPGYGEKFDDHGVEDILPGLLKPLEDTFETKYSGSEWPRDSKSAFPYAGGESVALERLEWYFHKGSPPPVSKYKATRNGLLGHEYSTKLSPFLCLGMISPRLIMKSLDDHEAKHGETQNTYWVRFELLWRDYFMYISRKFGSKLFTLGGFEEVTDSKQANMKTRPGWWNSWDPEGSDDQPAMRWMQGKTGVPFIDANMAELRESGFMSNRGRQNVASFLTKDLQVDWRIGAEFFESHLIDYEPTANYGNWQYVGGVGNDPRASRQFNPIKQANDYDPNGQYIKTWLPSLHKVPTSHIQCPWVLSASQRKDLIAEGSYPEKPVVEAPNWRPHYHKKGPGKTNGNKNERVKNPGPGGPNRGPKRQGNGHGGGPKSS